MTLVQAIAVQKNKGSHENVVRAVAQASLRAWINHSDLPSWEEWFAGPFTKSVRRGTPSQMAAMAPYTLGLGCVGSGEDLAEALAFAPMNYEDFPTPLAKMQVANFERPPEGDWHNPEHGPIVYINTSLGMSTGKTAAQVAHGVMGFARKLSNARLGAWWDLGLPFVVREWLGANFLDTDDPDWYDVLIRDNGLTEVDPGSPTVAVKGVGDFCLTQESP